MPAGLNTLQRRPQSHRLFPGVRGAHTLPGQPGQGQSICRPHLCERTELQGPAWDSAFLQPGRRAGTRGLIPQQPTPLGAFTFQCRPVCWLFKWEEDYHSLPWFLISPTPKGMAHSNWCIIQPIGGHLRKKPKNPSTVTGRCPTSGLHLSPPAHFHYTVGDTDFHSIPANDAW